MVPTCGGRSPRGHSSGERSAIAAETPWYAQSVTIPPRPPVYVVASRQARSFASLPEFTNMTVSSPGGIVATSRSASSTTVAWR